MRQGSRVKDPNIWAVEVTLTETLPTGTQLGTQPSPQAGELWSIDNRYYKPSELTDTFDADYFVYRAAQAAEDELKVDSDTTFVIGDFKGVSVSSSNPFETSAPASRRTR